MRLLSLFYRGDLSGVGNSRGGFPTHGFGQIQVLGVTGLLKTREIGLEARFLVPVETA